MADFAEFRDTQLQSDLGSFRPGVRAAVAAEDEYVNLASEARTTHILQRDGTGGGHLWPGAPGKTPFPEGWSAARVMHEISDVATDPCGVR